MARKRELLPTSTAPTLGYQQCEWSDGMMRCRYPGSLTTNMGIGGPWYCRAHFDCRDPIFGGQIVQASMDYRHPTNQERSAESKASAEAYCKSLGLNTLAQKRAWFREQAKKVGRLDMHRAPGEDSEEVAA